MFNKFIQRPVLSIVISLIIVFLGALAIIQLPVTQFPSISPPKVNVNAAYPGANNELLIKSVIIPLERALNGVPGMKYMAADAGNDGEATIQVIFNLGTDPNTDQKFLFNFADINLLSELKRVDGVGYADILGNREYAMRIWLKPDRMLAYKISADEVMSSLEQQSIEASPGKTGESSGKRSQSFEYVLNYSGRFTTKEQYENVVLKATPNGELLRLKDVADVEFGSSMYDIYSNLNGKPSAAIVLKQSYGSNASQVIKDVKAKLEEIKASSFPKGMEYELSY